MPLVSNILYRLGFTKIGHLLKYFFFILAGQFTCKHLSSRVIKSSRCTKQTRHRNAKEAKRRKNICMIVLLWKIDNVLKNSALTYQFFRFRTKKLTGCFLKILNFLQSSSLCVKSSLNKTLVQTMQCITEGTKISFFQGPFLMALCNYGYFSQKKTLLPKTQASLMELTNLLLSACFAC